MRIYKPRYSIRSMIILVLLASLAAFSVRTYLESRLISREIQKEQAAIDRQVERSEVCMAGIRFSAEITSADSRERSLVFWQGKLRASNEAMRKSATRIGNLSKGFGYPWRSADISRAPAKIEEVLPPPDLAIP